MLKHIGSHALFRGAIILVIGVISSLAFIGIPLVLPRSGAHSLDA
jgi:hypothetical protein